MAGHAAAGVPAFDGHRDRLVGRRRLPRATSDLAAFTLIELLVVVGIVATLIAILVPSLTKARAQARLALCSANLRAQGTIVHQYALDHRGALPPKMVSYAAADGVYSLLINRVLADYMEQPFSQSPLDQYAWPTGIWRCPDVPSNRDYYDRWTHEGFLHHAPNAWVFDTLWVNLVEDTILVDATAYPGWQAKYGGEKWRQVQHIRRPSDIVAIIDNVTYQYGVHGHRESSYLIGEGYQVITAQNPIDTRTDQTGGHDILRRRPAVLMDGHIEAFPSTPAYWHDQRGLYQPGGPSGPVYPIYHREVQHFLWFAAPEDYLGPAD